MNSFKAYFPNKQNGKQPNFDTHVTWIAITAYKNRLKVIAMTRTITVLTGSEIVQSLHAQALLKQVRTLHRQWFVYGNEYYHSICITADRDSKSYLLPHMPLH